FMLENTWYSVIAPESCSSILWRSREYKEEAAESLKLTPENMRDNKLIDGIIKEPLGGAHSDHKATFEIVKNTIIKQVDKLQHMDEDERIDKRVRKFNSMGVVNTIKSNKTKGAKKQQQSKVKKKKG
ncbi:MAG: hypothetical protein ABEH43_05135, partial [Flavobacteriales bacterium]